MRASSLKRTSYLSFPTAAVTSAAAYGLLFPLIGLAQVGPSSGEAVEPGVATVNIRSSRPTLQERFQAPGARVVVGREDIEQMGADTVSDVLRQLPGVFATTGSDGRTEIRMRGMDRSATQILVDGERTSNGRRGGQLPFDQIPSELIERIEVVRATTAEFSGASGGTINIVLKQAVVQRETNVRLTNQHFNDKNAAQFFFSRTGPVGEIKDQSDLPPEKRSFPTTYFFMISAYERLGGIERVGQTTYTDPSKANFVDNKRDTSQSRTKEVLLIPRFTIKPNLWDTFTINPMLIATQTRSSVEGNVSGVGSGGAYTLQSSDLTKTNRTLARVSTTWAHRFKTTRLETRLSGERSNEETERGFSSVASGGSFGNSVSALTDQRSETVWNLATKLQGAEDSKVWAVGSELDYRVLTADTNNTASSPVVSSSVLTYRAEQLRLALWGQNEWSIAKGTLVGGLRVETVQRDTVSAGISYDDRWLRWQPSLNYRAPISSDVQFRAGIAQVTRIPALLDVVDRYVPSVGINSPTRPGTLGNPTLRSETTLSLDIGVEMRIGAAEPKSASNSSSAAPAGGGRSSGSGVGGGGGARAGSAPVTAGQAGINFFLRDISDPIVRRTFQDATRGNDWVQRPENGLGGIAWGIETDIRMPLNAIGLSGWNLNGTASAFKSSSDLPGSNGNFVKGRIPGQPHYLANLSIAKPIPRAGGFFGGATLNFVGAADLRDSELSGGRSRSVARLDAFVGQVVAGLGYWRLGIFNINNVGRDRLRIDPDGVFQRVEQTTDKSGRSIFLTVGTRF